MSIKVIKTKTKVSFQFQKVSKEFRKWLSDNSFEYKGLTFKSDSKPAMQGKTIYFPGNISDMDDDIIKMNEEDFLIFKEGIAVLAKKYQKYLESLKTKDEKVETSQIKVDDVVKFE